MNALPLRKPFSVSPMPQYLVGFKTLEEAAEAQRCCLNDPIETVASRSLEWASRDDVVVLRCENPEPQTDGPTVWMQR